MTTANWEGCILTTTPTLEGYTIRHYLGPVFAHRALGVVESNLATDLSDIFKVELATHENNLHRVTEHVLDDLEELGAELGGNGIVGLQLTCSATQHTLIVTAVGTAVELAPVVQRR